jgi:glutathione peroxidase
VSNDSQKGVTAASSDAKSVLDHTLPTLTGDEQNLAEYKGKVALVVNTATECGFTPQFDGLEKLYEQKKGEGFVILGFPADDVAHQEPRDDEAIGEFCKANYGVSFPMFHKSNVKDEPLNPVYAELNPVVGPPGWNFNKVLLDKQGKPVKRFEVSTEPDDPELVGAIDAELKKS